jgi:hypothetical protein
MSSVVFPSSSTVLRNAVSGATSPKVGPEW